MNFFTEHMLEIIFGTITTITSIIAIYFAYKSYKLEQEKKDRMKFGNIIVYPSREAMVKGLFEMYDFVESNDIMWFQTVGMRNYPAEVHSVVLQAANKGLKFKMILNSNSPSLGEFTQLFSGILNKETVKTSDNNIRIQGLSDKQVIIAFPSLTAYVGIKFTDKHFVKIIKNWFDSRFASLKENVNNE